MPDNGSTMAATPMIARLRSLAGALTGRGDPSDLRGRRLAGLLQGLVTSLGNKALAVVISFVSVPLTIGYLGPERFGAWVVIGSALAWLGLTDFGLGHGLTNAVTTAASQDRPDVVRMHLSNFIALMSGIALAITPFLVLAWYLVDLPALFGVHSPGAVRELNGAVVVAVVLFLLKMPLTVTMRVYNAYQEGRIANYWAAAGNVVSLLCLLVVVRTSGGLPLLILALTGSGIVLELANMAWLFFRHRPAVRPGIRHLAFSRVSEISAIGVQFFIIQAMALITFQTDSLVIAHYLGAEVVPTYSVTYSLFNYAALPQAMLFPYLWTAYNEAIARGDIAWVRRTFRLNLVAGVACTALVAAAMVLICKPFIAWWVGPAIVPSTALAATMALWTVINAYGNPIACLFAAASHLRNQIIYSAVCTAANLALSLYLVHRLGVVGVIGGTVIAYLLFNCGPIWFDAQHLFRKLERRGAAVA